MVSKWFACAFTAYDLERDISIQLSGGFYGGSYGGGGYESGAIFGSGGGAGGSGGRKCGGIYGFEEYSEILDRQTNRLRNRTTKHLQELEQQRIAEMLEEWGKAEAAITASIYNLALSKGFERLSYDPTSLEFVAMTPNIRWPVKFRHVSDYRLFFNTPTSEAIIKQGSAWNDWFYTIFADKVTLFNPSESSDLVAKGHISRFFHAHWDYFRFVRHITYSPEGIPQIEWVYGAVYDENFMWARWSFSDN